VKQFFHQLANFRDASRAADEDDLFNLVGAETSILQRLLAGANGAVNDRLN